MEASAHDPGEVIMNIPLTPIRFLRYASQQFPGKTAVVCGDQRITYAQFSDRAARLAGALRAQEIQPGDRVAFLSANCHRLLEAYYGVLQAGAVLLPLNIRLAAHELAYILNDSETKVLFFEDQFSGLVDSFRKELHSLRSFFLLNSNPAANWASPLNYEDILAGATPYHADVMQFDENALGELFYTSGTSTNPKGVMLTHRNIYLHALSAALNFNTGSETVELPTIPLFHANGWGVAHSLTFVGGTHVMMQKFDPAEVFRLIERERVHAFSLVPTMATALVNCPERPKYDLSSLKRITIGGAASSPTLVREVEDKIGCTCFSGYGLTETAPLLTVSPVKHGVYWEGQERYEGQARTGFAIAGVEIRIVDAEGKDVPHDGKSTGEIVARSDAGLAGSSNQPQTTCGLIR